MLSALLAMAALTPVVSAPTGVNDAVLGEAKDYAFQGPGRVCLREAWLDLSKGETAYLRYSGIHFQTIVIDGPSGILELKEGEAWAKPKGERTLLLRKAGMEVFDIGTDMEFRYLVYGANQYSNGQLVPKIWLDGGALVGDGRDRKLVSRISIGALPAKNCNMTYNYGWGVLLEGEPMVMRRNERE